MYEETKLYYVVFDAEIGTKLLDYYTFATNLISKLERQVRNRSYWRLSLNQAEDWE